MLRSSVRVASGKHLEEHWVHWQTSSIQWSLPITKELKEVLSSFVLWESLTVWLKDYLEWELSVFLLDKSTILCIACKVCGSHGEWELGCLSDFGNHGLQFAVIKCSSWMISEVL